MKKQHIHPLRQLALATGIAVSALAAIPAAHAGGTGNIGVFSKYVLRGNTGSCDALKAGTAGACTAAENSGTTVQGGFDYAADNGLFVGYWASNLDYTYDKTGAGYAGAGFENDFYGGYSGKVGDVSYSLGLTKYVYMNVDDSDLVEPFATVGVGPVTLGVKYLAQDGFWGNKGDMYWTVAAGADLPAGFKLAGTLGYYMYEKEDSAELCGGTAGCGLTKTDSAFRHLDLTLSHPIGKTGAEMNVTYVVGGKDRMDQDLENTIVLGLKYPFDL